MWSMAHSYVHVVGVQLLAKALGVVGARGSAGIPSKTGSRIVQVRAPARLRLLHCDAIVVINALTLFTATIGSIIFSCRLRRLPWPLHATNAPSSPALVRTHTTCQTEGVPCSDTFLAHTGRCF